MPSLTRTCFAAVLLAACLLHGLGAVAGAEEGSWSRNSFLLPAQAPFRVPSPDRTKTVFVEGTALSVLDGGQQCSGLEGYSLLGHAELAWSPDSKAFVVTASEGGQGGAWFITVFQVQNVRVTLSEPVEGVNAKMHERYPCLGQEDPNLGAIWWVKGSTQLLVAAEVPARSSCGEKGQIRGYLIDVPTGKIMYEFDAALLKETFSEHLGRRFTRPPRP
jgi:WD40 repeat protein